MKMEKPTDSPPSRTAWFRRRKFLLWLLVVLGLAATAVTWDQVKYQFIPKRFGVVVSDKIYRSGQIDKSLIEKVLREHQIREVVDFTGVEPDNPNQAAEAKTCQKLGIATHRFPLKGNGTGDPEAYVQALKVMAEAASDGRPLLVHCAAGSQRTGAAVAYFRMLIENRPPSEAYREMEKYKWKPRHDQVLAQYINDHMQEVAEGLVADGTLDKMPSPLPVFGP